MTFGNQADEGASHAILHKAFEAGVDFLAVAEVYPGPPDAKSAGRSEESVGKWMAEKPRDAIILATKVAGPTGGWFQGPVRSGHTGLDRHNIERACETSLRRLGTDYIDLYQTHWPDPKLPLEETMEALDRLVDEGKVRYIAVSNFSGEQMERVGKIARVASLQPPYSMLNRGIEKEVLPYCASHEIGVVAYSPMAKGLLTGKVTKEWVASLPDDDHRKKGGEFNEPQLSVNAKLVDGLRGIAESRSHTPARLAVAWVLRRSEVTSAIVGARRPSQIEETAPAGDWEMSAEDVEAVQKLLDKLLEERTAAL